MPLRRAAGTPQVPHRASYLLVLMVFNWKHWVLFACFADQSNSLETFLTLKMAPLDIQPPSPPTHNKRGSSREKLMGVPDGSIAKGFKLNHSLPELDLPEVDLEYILHFTSDSK